jgi:hypothetical protein
MRIIAFSCQKSNADVASFNLTKNGTTATTLIGNGYSSYRKVNNVIVLESGSLIRLQASHINYNNVLTSCLVALYFVPVRTNQDPLGDRSLNVIVFGGNVAIERRLTLLRIGAQATTGLDTNMNYVGTMFTVPAPMRLFRVGYQKSSLPNYDTTLQFYKNGQPWNQVTCHLWRSSGVVDFRLPDDSPLRQLEAGDVIQLAYERGIMPGGCLVTLYTTQGTQLGPESGDIEQ